MVWKVKLPSVAAAAVDVIGVTTGEDVGGVARTAPALLPSTPILALAPLLLIVAIPSAIG
jgi:hypothetical protein